MRVQRNLLVRKNQAVPGAFVRFLFLCVCGGVWYHEYREVIWEGKGGRKGDTHRVAFSGGGAGLHFFTCDFSLLRQSKP